MDSIWLGSRRSELKGMYISFTMHIRSLLPLIVSWMWLLFIVYIAYADGSKPPVSSLTSIPGTTPVILFLRSPATFVSSLGIFTESPLPVVCQ